HPFQVDLRPRERWWPWLPTTPDLVAASAGPMCALSPIEASGLTSFAALLIVKALIHTVQARAAGPWSHTGRLLVPSPAGGGGRGPSRGGGEAWGEEPWMKVKASPSTHRPDRAGEQRGEHQYVDGPEHPRVGARLPRDHADEACREQQAGHGIVPHSLGASAD